MSCTLHEGFCLSVVSYQGHLNGYKAEASLEPYVYDNITTVNVLLQDFHRCDTLHRPSLLHCEAWNEEITLWIEAAS